MGRVESLISAVRSGLAELADAAKAPEMQAYMKSEMPFRGVPKPARAALLKRVFAENPLPDRVSFSSAVLTLHVNRAGRRLLRESGGRRQIRITVLPNGPLAISHFRVKLITRSN